MYKNVLLFIAAISLACIALALMVGVNTYIKPAPISKGIDSITVVDPSIGEDECMILYKGPDNTPAYRIGPC